MSLLVIVTQIVDTAIGSLADVLKNFTVSFWGVVLFVVMSVVYGFGQYSILEMVKSRNKENKSEKSILMFLKI